ncbi:MAG TPA: SufS family cysteine desulfurase [Candidatus Saccharimonadales bacterium]|nr:SufS family cysteine desulfurase [Candidatus Saccharimonadales bacterium]
MQANAQVDWSKIRRDFPILDQEVNGHPLIYFDNAATSQKPRPVLDALLHYYERDNANVHRGIHALSDRATGAYEAARERAARFLHARHPQEIIFTRGTTEGINLVAQTWALDHLKPGDAILLSELEHHSNLVPWQMVAKRTGARLVYIPITGDEGTLDLEHIDALLGDGVRLLALTHISNSMAVINPVADLCARARRHGVVTVIDAAQSAGHLPLDVQAIGCDFLAFSSHKVCGPTGLGVLYGREELLADLSPYQGGGEMISQVEYFQTTYNVPPHRFEAGTPHIAGAVGLHAALDYLDAIGRERIFAHDQDLAHYAVERLREFKDIRIFGPHEGRAGLVSFVLAQAHALDLATLADQRGLALRAGHHCNQPLMAKLGVPATLRASFYFYNHREEVDRAIDILRSMTKLLS